MKSTIVTILWALFGGLMVWLPSVCLHFASGYRFGAVEVILILVLMPFAASFIRGVLLRKRDRIWLVSLTMLLGVWLFGPVSMMVAGSASGGGFTISNVWSDLLMVTLLFPLATWCGSAYDGSLGGLVLATIVLVIKPGLVTSGILDRLSD